MLNVNETLAKAEKDGEVYPIKLGWKIPLILCGVFVCLLIVGIPLGIWLIIIFKNSRVGLTDEGFAFKGVVSFAGRWEDVEEFDSSKSFNFRILGGGLVALAGATISSAVAANTQGLTGPLRIKIKGKSWKILPGHTIANSHQMVLEMEKRTGLAIFPRPVEDADAE